MESIGTKGKKASVFWLGVVLCVGYLAYRYPLQINDSGTSSTYSDTPAVLQAGKFILAVPLIILSLMQWISNSLRLSKWSIALCALFLCTFSCMKLLQQNDTQYINLMFWLFFGMSLVLGVGEITISAVDSCFRVLLWYSFATTIVQVGLFAAFGRLPALAFAGTYAVRFGGFIDDPNGFAAILFLLMGWAHERYRGGSWFMVLGALTICLFLTQSWTAIAFFFGLVFLMALIRSLKRPLTATLAIAAAPVLGFVAWRLVPLFQAGFFLEMLDRKQSSIEGHIFPWDFWFSRWKDWALLGDWKYNSYESWWQAAMVNFGLVWCVAYLALVTALVVVICRAYSKAAPESKPVFAGLMLFGLYFLIGSFNLPFPIVFPVNALFFLFSFLVAFQKVRGDDGATVSSYANQMIACATTAYPE